MSLEGFTWFLYHAPASAFFPQKGFTWFLYHACKAALAVPLAFSSCLRRDTPKALRKSAQEENTSKKALAVKKQQKEGHAHRKPKQQYAFKFLDLVAFKFLDLVALTSKKGRAVSAFWLG